MLLITSGVHTHTWVAQNNTASMTQRMNDCGSGARQSKSRL